MIGDFASDILVLDSALWPSGYMLDLILLIYIKNIAELFLLTYSMEQSPSWEANRF